MEEIPDFLQKNEVKIAALTIPGENAACVAAKLISCGVRAFWNFAPTDLDLPEEIVLENVHLSESLMRLSYKLKSASVHLGESEEGDGGIETE